MSDQPEHRRSAENVKDTGPVIDWSALKVGDPDPEPQAIGLACASFVLNTLTEMRFDCTRGDHEGDPLHVSCAWTAPMTPDDAVVVAKWTDEPDGSTTRVECISPSRWSALLHAAERRNR